MTIADQLREHALYHRDAEFLWLSNRAYEAVWESGFYGHNTCSAFITEDLRRFYLLMLAESLE